MSYKRSDYAGGIAKLYLVPAAHVPTRRVEPGVGLVTLPGLKNYLIPLQFAIDTGRFSVINKLGAYQVRIEAFIPSSLRDDAFSFFSRYINMPFNVLIMDYNGNYLFFGNRDNFFIYRPAFDAPADFSEASGFKWSLSRDMVIAPAAIASPFIKTPPAAFAVKIPAEVIEDHQVFASYTYQSYDSLPESGSVYAWHYADTVNGVKTKIAGQTGLSYTPSAAMVNKYLFFSVIPSDGIDQGTEVFSNASLVTSAQEYVEPDSVPVAMAVDVDGTVQNSFTVTGRYNYYDADGDPENGSLFAWFVSDNASGTNPVKVSSQKTLLLTYSHSGKYIRFSVTPANAKAIGTEASSDWKVVQKKQFSVELLPADFVVRESNLAALSQQSSGGVSFFRLTDQSSSQSNNASIIVSNNASMGIPSGTRVTITYTYRWHTVGRPRPTLFTKASQVEGFSGMGTSMIQWSDSATVPDQWVTRTGILTVSFNLNYMVFYAIFNDFYSTGDYIDIQKITIQYER